VSEFELLRQAFVATPDPDAASVEAGRAALMREVKRSHPLRRRRQLYAAVAVVVALAAVVFLIVPRANDLSGTEIAAAADSALTPRARGIWHVVEVVHAVPGPTSRIETWETTGPPYVIRRITKQPGATPTDEAVIGCGSVFSTQGTITLSLRPRSIAGWIERPVLSYRRALRGKHIVYAGDTTVHGVLAYKLVVRDPFRGSAGYRSGGVVTTLVRHGSYYPLETIGVYTYRTFEKGRWHSSGQREVINYSTFALLPRNATTESFLRINPPPGAFVISDEHSKASPQCARAVQNLLRRP
jgi:hypothetical protein